MNKLLISILLLGTLSVHASLNEDTQKEEKPNSKSNTLVLPVADIEAVVSKDGTYARIIDIQEGFENFNGLSVNSEKLIINISTDMNIGRIILNNGNSIYERSISDGGGDMGGG
jgi:predicted acetyltransferase